MIHSAKKLKILKKLYKLGNESIAGGLAASGDPSGENEIEKDMRLVEEAKKVEATKRQRLADLTALHEVAKKELEAKKNPTGVVGKLKNSRLGQALARFRDLKLRRGQGQEKGQEQGQGQGQDDDEAPPFKDEASALAAGKTRAEIDAWKKSHQGPGQVGAGLALNENWGRIRAKAMARRRAQPGGGDMRFAQTFVGKGGGKTAGDMEGEHPKRAGGGAAAFCAHHRVGALSRRREYT